MEVNDLPNEQDVQIPEKTFLQYVETDSFLASPVQAYGDTAKIFVRNWTC